MSESLTYASDPKQVSFSEVSENKSESQPSEYSEYDYFIPESFFAENKKLARNETNDNAVIKCSGRVIAIRVYGNKLFFFTVSTGYTSKTFIQLIGRIDILGIPRPEFKKIQRVNLGTIVKFAGKAHKSRTGEFSVLLTYIEPIVNVDDGYFHLHELIDTEYTENSKSEEYSELEMGATQIKPKTGKSRKTRKSNTNGKGMIDIAPWLKPQRRDNMIHMHFIRRIIRDYLEGMGFIELFTPVIQEIHGGANATPFRTYAADQKKEMSLRIAPELELKKAVIGGLGRVYEIGKQFRNEGRTLRHNPEFTTLEFYIVMRTYRDIMGMTIELFQRFYNYFEKGEFVYDVIEYIPAVENAIGKSIPSPYNSDEANAIVRAECDNRNIEHSGYNALDKLFSETVEKHLELPTFVIHQPAFMSPLAMPNAENSHVSDRFELIAGGMELANAYSELNDPKIQERNFMEQVASKDDESMPYDSAFIEALKRGMPPTAGFGMGIERLMMFLMNKKDIKTFTNI